MKKLFKPDVCALLRVGVRHLGSLLASGVIPPADGIERKGGSYWYLTPELRRLLKDQRRPPRKTG